MHISKINTVDNDYTILHGIFKSLIALTLNIVGQNHLSCVDTHSRRLKKPGHFARHFITVS